MSQIQKIIKIGAIILAISIIINIFSLVMSVLSSIFNIDILKSNKEITNFKEEYQNVERIKIDGTSSSIEIKSGKSWNVETKNIENNFTSKLKNGTLKIEEHDGWFKKQNTKGKIYITIPKGVTLEELSIDMGAGKFIIEDIEVRDFDMDHGAGNLEIKNVNFYEADIDGGAGAIKIKDSELNNLELDAGAGKVMIESLLTGNNQISCGVGELDITLLGKKEDYQIITEKGIGSIKINKEEQKNSTIYGNGNTKLKIEGGIGNIKVDFKR